MGHYCENEYCGSGRSYWVDGDPGQTTIDGGIEPAKFYRKDHNPVKCAIRGGDCRGVSSPWWPWRVVVKGTGSIERREIKRFRNKEKALQYAEWLHEDGRDVEVI